jgi:hypothetical protein
MKVVVNLTYYLESWEGEEACLVADPETWQEIAVGISYPSAFHCLEVVSLRKYCESVNVRQWRLEHCG